MCKQCEKNSVYEFTNKRKLCRICFIRWFQKKFLYVNRKFQMIKKNDIVGFDNKGDFRGVVLEDVLEMYAEKFMIGMVKMKLPSLRLGINKKLLKKESEEFNLINNSHKSRAKRGKVPNKIAIPTTLDIESDKAIHILIKGDSENLKELSPVQGKMIKPLYLFSDEEVLLYVKLRGLKFKIKKEKKDEIKKFVEGLEKKHPEVKNAIVKSVLGLYE